MIQRLMISSCRSIIGTYRRAVPNLLRVIKAGFPVHCAYILHKRSFYDSAIRSEKINPENGCGVIVNVPTFQIKKRSSKRKTVIHDKIVKPNEWTVKALSTAEEYNLEALSYGLLDQQLYIPSKISIATNRKYLLSI